MGITRRLYQLQAIELDIESKEQTLAQSLAGLGESRALLEVRDGLLVGERRLEELKKKLDNALQTASANLPPTQ